MKKIKIFIISLFVTLNCQAQNNDVWHAFFNSDSTLIGFKNTNGIIKIKPKFTVLTIAKKFKDIIVVSEKENSKYLEYYITKSGKKVGFDKLFVFDNAADCESEGYIRFLDKKSDKVGVFNSDGNIAIPAEYNALTNVRNGLIISLKGATKQPDTHNNGCNHYTWSGGTGALIDINNKVIIPNFNSKNNLNLFSIKKEKNTDNQDVNREYFQGNNNAFYSFIDFEKEFQNWFKNDLLNGLSKESLEKASYNKITYWDEIDGWKSQNKKDFINVNFENIKTKLNDLKKKDADFFITSNGLNSFMFEGSEFEKYYNNCNESKYWQYPVLSFIINKKNGNQDGFEFLRTENGYQLISISFKN